MSTLVKVLGKLWSSQVFSLAQGHRVHDLYDLSLYGSYSEALRKSSLSEGIEDYYRRYSEHERSEECPIVSTILASKLCQSNR